MGTGFVLVIALIVFAVVTLAKGVRIVPQGMEWIVERLGKYSSTLHPGLNIIIPYLDKVAYKLVTKDIILDVQEQEVITKDNAVILINAIAFIKITDPIKAVYGVTDFSEAIRNMIMTTLRSIAGDMDLDQALTSRDKIKARLREAIADEAIDWGLTVKSVEIQDIKPSESMVRAMEAQASAERERKAMVTKAEGSKQSAILQAEARLELDDRHAQGHNDVGQTTGSPDIHGHYPVLAGRRGAYADRIPAARLLQQFVLSSTPTPVPSSASLPDIDGRGWYPQPHTVTSTLRRCPS